MVRPPDAGALAEAAALAAWDDLLRAYAETIELQRSYLLSLSSLDDVDEALLAVPGFEIPTDLPPMPASLERWATSLLSETAGLAALARQILDDRPATASSGAARASRFAAAPSGSSLDQKI
ncbi:MAG: hypothetical protein R2713_10025 [Ilumatobacteraceae bacterium]|nr:hypothetical protein [Acidimicrobiales bacterium]MCB9392778.1 hypothetical protein [Acidimicrobiaceae bacterium]